MLLPSMSPQSFDSFRFSARCLAVNSIGALHHIDALGCNRALSEPAGVKAVSSLGFGGARGIAHTMVVADARLQTSSPFRTAIRLLLDVLAWRPKRCRADSRPDGVAARIKRRKERPGLVRWPRVLAVGLGEH